MYSHPFGALIADFTHRIAQRWSATRADTLHDLDHRTLRDMGIDASEIESITAETRGIVAPTRRRVVVEVGHG